MQLHSLFNAVLLTLSIATLILTMISYGLYKWKQIPRSDDTGTRSTKKIEGAFFKRILTPELIEQFTPVSSSVTSTFSPDRSIHFLHSKYIRFFLIIAFTVFISFMFESWILSDPFSNKSDAYVKRVQSLNSQGLYQRYAFNLPTETINTDESIAPAVEKQMNQLAHALRQRNIILFSSDQNKKFNPVASNQGVQRWMQFLARHGIPYRVSNELPEVGRTTILVMPQSLSLSQTQRADLERYLRGGGPIVATGPIGMMDGQGGDVAPDWTAQNFKIQFKPKSNQTSSMVVFSGRSQPLWEIPPGTEILWPSLDSRFFTQLVPTAAQHEWASAWEFQDTTLGLNSAQVIAASIQENNKRILWTALDPAPAVDRPTALNTYQELAFMSWLAWSCRTPMQRIANWPSGKSASIVPVLNLNEMNGDAEDLVELFSEKDSLLTASLLFHPQQIKKSGSFMDSQLARFEAIIDVGNDDYLATLNSANRDNLIETYRLDAELVSGKRSPGLAAGRIVFNRESLNSLYQNRLNFLFGDSPISRLAPVLVSGGQLAFIPDSQANDLKLKQRSDLNQKEDLLKAIQNHHQIVKQLGGMQALQIHSDIYSERSFEYAFENFIKQIKTQPDLAYMNLGEVNQWWINRSQLKLENTSMGFKVINGSQNNLGPIAIEMDDGQHYQQLPLESLKPLSDAVVSKNQSNSKKETE